LTVRLSTPDQSDVAISTIRYCAVIENPSAVQIVVPAGRFVKVADEGTDEEN
jgi:hypothetical protein